MNLKRIAAISVVAIAVDMVAIEAHPFTVARVHGPAAVNCGAGRRPVVRHVSIDGRRVERVTCVSAARSHRPAGHVRHRSWKKSALVIGGATAAGAGAGALIGGKKGALIGAAAGAGAGTVYEIHKRHKRRHRR